jgi:MmeI, DNA-methyltransferase domain
MNRTTRKDLQARCQAIHQRMTEELRVQVEDEGTRSDYAFTLLLRLLFIYFLQQQGVLDGDACYLQTRLERCRDAGQPFSLFLACLTYWGFGTPATERSGFVEPLLGKVPYVSGSLFSPHPSERQGLGRATWAVPELSNQVFDEALAAFGWYRWTLVEGAGFSGPEGLVTPAFLGTLAEHRVEHRKQTGSFYTPEPICSYIVRETCEPLILQQYEQLTGRHFDSIEPFLAALEARDCALLLFVILPTLSILDPACGAGDFLVAALDRITALYQQVIERAAGLRHHLLEDWISDFDRGYPCREFGLRKRVASRNLFGVDIQQTPLEVAKLRLALNLLKCVGRDEVELALPNLDYALPRGNSLVGIARITEKEQVLLARLHPGYGELVRFRNELVRLYRTAVGNPVTLASLRADIDDCRDRAYQSLNRVLLEQLNEKQEAREGAGEGRKTRRGRRESGFTLEGLVSMDPFHYALDFDEVMHGSCWARLDNEEAEVVQVDGKLGVRFGPERGRPPLTGSFTPGMGDKA